MPFPTTNEIAMDARTKMCWPSAFEILLQLKRKVVAIVTICGLVFSTRPQSKLCLRAKTNKLANRHSWNTKVWLFSWQSPLSATQNFHLQFTPPIPTNLHWGGSPRRSASSQNYRELYNFFEASAFDKRPIYFSPLPTHTSVPEF